MSKARSEDRLYVTRTYETKEGTYKTKDFRITQNPKDFFRPCWLQPVSLAPYGAILSENLFLFSSFTSNDVEKSKLTNKK